MPTSTGSGPGDRPDLPGASFTEAVFELECSTTVEAVNAALEAVADGALARILGYVIRPLVSVDDVSDPRSAIVNRLSTLGLNGAQHGALPMWVLQVAALPMLIPVSDQWPKRFRLAYGMAAQAISGIAADPNQGGRGCGAWQDQNQA